MGLGVFGKAIIEQLGRIHMMMGDFVGALRFAQRLSLPCRDTMLPVTVSAFVIHQSSLSSSPSVGTRALLRRGDARRHLSRRAMFHIREVLLVLIQRCASSLRTVW